MGCAGGRSIPILNVRTDKTVYWRYELVGVEVRIAGDVRPGEVKTITGWVSRRGRMVTTVGRDSVFFLSPDGSGEPWRLSWPPPWNPPLGPYLFHASAELTDGRTARDSVEFRLAGRNPKGMEPGYAVLTLEDTNDLTRLPLPPSPRGRSGSLTNFVGWAEYLNADALWYSVGQTIEGKPGVTDGSPWFPDNLRVYPVVGRAIKEAGLDFGAWIGCYFLWGPKLNRLSYRYNIDYDSDGDRLFTGHRVSLLDRKRRDDIVRLARRLQDDPVVDHIGFDYIRGGTGGYEMVNEFARDMYVTVPSDWAALDYPGRVGWLARCLELQAPADLKEKWDWWRAHLVASIVDEIIWRAGVTKPVWVFILGWRMGHQHGQDPLMMIDAGVSWPAVMLYESDAEQVRQMGREWTDYLKPGQMGFLAGQQVDWELLQNSLSPPGPQECYRRLVESMAILNGGEPVDGLFWHDLHRLVWGKLGPFTPVEWGIAGAAAFSRLRSRVGRLPVELLVAARRGDSGGSVRAAVVVINHRAEPLRGLVLRWLRTPGLEPTGGPETRIARVDPERPEVVEFAFRPAAAAAIAGRPPMVAFELVGDGPQGCLRTVAFDFLRVENGSREDSVAGLGSGGN